MASHNEAIDRASAVMVLIDAGYGIGTRTLVEISKDRARRLVEDASPKPLITWDASRLVLRPAARDG